MSREKYGAYDAIICSGILYHLDSTDAFAIIERIYDVLGDLAVFDTYICLDPNASVSCKQKTYHGRVYVEHSDNDSDEAQLRRGLASYGNRTSFWFSRPSLINMFSSIGFSSTYECFNPPHLNFGQSGLEHSDR